MKLDKQEIMSTDARGQRSDGSDEITWSLRLLHQHYEWPTTLRGKEYLCTLFLQCPIPPTSPDSTSLTLALFLRQQTLLEALLTL